MPISMNSPSASIVATPAGADCSSSASCSTRSLRHPLDIGLHALALKHKTTTCSGHCTQAATPLLAMILGFSVAIAFPGLSIHTHWRVLFDVGIVVWLSGTRFRFYSMRTLGRFFTYDVAVSTGQHVVERGPYRWLRHPSYLGSLVANIGLGMTLTNWLAIFLPALCLAFAFAYRIPIEEQALLEGLGTPYRDYMRRTWRLIPFLF